jgi:hypothetical protein
MRDCSDRHLGGGSDGRAYRSGRLVRRAAYCSGWLLILAAQSFNERPNRAGLMTSEDTDTGRALTKMRWGMPPPPRTGGPPVTNIRNTSSPHWRMWLKPENRCLVPANSFAEYAPEPNLETTDRSCVPQCGHSSRSATGLGAAFVGSVDSKSKAGRGPRPARSVILLLGGCTRY